MTARSVATVTARLQPAKCSGRYARRSGKEPCRGRERLGFSFGGTDTPILVEELAGTGAERQ